MQNDIPRAPRFIEPVAAGAAAIVAICAAAPCWDLIQGTLGLRHQLAQHYGTGMRACRLDTSAGGHPVAKRGVDRDEGEVLLGRAVPVPTVTVPCAYAGLVMAACLAFVGASIAGWAALICGILAILYSDPRTVWKGQPVLGPLVNFVGYGLLSPLAGWGVVGVDPDPRTIIVWLLSGLAVVGCYFAAQAFQREEDRVRGYRTLVVTHGPRATLVAARMCIGGACFGGAALAMAGWLPRLLLVATPLGWWVDRWLRRWSRQPGGGGERWAHGLAWRLLLASGVCVALAYLAFELEVLAEVPVAGLGTAGGHPPFATDPP